MGKRTAGYKLRIDWEHDAVLRRYHFRIALEPQMWMRRDDMPQFTYIISEKALIDTGGGVHEEFLEKAVHDFIAMGYTPHENNELLWWKEIGEDDWGATYKPEYFTPTPITFDKAYYDPVSSVIVGTDTSTDAYFNELTKACEL